jgi:hypothetical protein
MPHLTVSVFSLTGDPTATIQSLMAYPKEGSSDLSTLSTNNLPTSNSTPNQDNQRVFMNQPLSWWISELNSGKIKYTPVSNSVNWSYENASGSIFYIDRSVTNTIIPNKTKSVEQVPNEKKTVIIYEPKYGVNRRDTYTL